jgi:3-phenylpropionate/trans-cinnamate dioxygenase ferredoxin component
MAEWVDVAAVEQLREGGRWLMRRAGCEIALFHVQGQLYAIDDSCPHAGASLATSKLEGTTVTCRAHGLRFELGSGCMRGAAGLQVRTYPVRVQHGRIEVDIAPAGGRGPA